MCTVLHWLTLHPSHDWCRARPEKADEWGGGGGRGVRRGLRHSFFFLKIFGSIFQTRCSIHRTSPSTLTKKKKGLKKGLPPPPPPPPKKKKKKKKQAYAPVSSSRPYFFLKYQIKNKISSLPSPLQFDENRVNLLQCITSPPPRNWRSFASFSSCEFILLNSRLGVSDQCDKYQWSCKYQWHARGKLFVLNACGGIYFTFIFSCVVGVSSHMQKLTLQWQIM